MRVDGVTVELELRPAPGRLVARYRVTNRREQAVWLLDDMLVHGRKGLVRAPGTLIITEAEDPRTLGFIRGLARPESNVITMLIPGARLLMPDSTLEGEAETELPLRVRHPQDDPRSIRGERDQV